MSVDMREYELIKRKISAAHELIEKLECDLLQESIRLREKWDAEAKERVTEYKIGDKLVVTSSSEVNGEVYSSEYRGEIEDIVCYATSQLRENEDMSSEYIPNDGDEPVLVLNYPCEWDRWGCDLYIPVCLIGKPGSATITTVIKED